jgi:hypothetical protein
VISETIFEQVNKSAIKLEMNGRSSVGPKSRNINIRYFWIRDATERNNIKIQHCPTALMLADFFTKPLQGSLFRQFRDVLLGHQSIDVAFDPPLQQTEERVGEERSEATRADDYERRSNKEKVDRNMKIAKNGTVQM